MGSRLCQESESGGNLELGEGPGLPWLGIREWDTKGLSEGLGALGPKGLEPNYYSILVYSSFIHSFIHPFVHSFPTVYKSSNWQCVTLNTHTHTNAHTLSQTHTHKRTHSQKHTYTLTNTHTHTHTHTLQLRYARKNLWTACFKCKGFMYFSLGATELSVFETFHRYAWFWDRWMHYHSCLQNAFCFLLDPYGWICGYSQNDVKGTNSIM